MEIDEARKIVAGAQTGVDLRGLAKMLEDDNLLLSADRQLASAALTLVAHGRKTGAFERMEAYVRYGPDVYTGSDDERWSDSSLLLALAGQPDDGAGEEGTDG